MSSPNITFDSIPSSIRKPGKYFEFNTSLAIRSLPGNLQKMLILALGSVDSPIYPLTPTRVFSDGQAGLLFGTDSPAHRMARAALEANPYLDLTVMTRTPDTTDPARATGSLTIGANDATTSFMVGLTIFKDGQNLYESSTTIDVEEGKTQAVLAAEAAQAINSELLHVTAVALNGVVTLHAVNAGTAGNGYEVRAAVMGTGITFTSVATSGGDDGVIAEEITAMLGQVFAAEYNVIATQFNNETDLLSLRDHLDAAAGAIEQRGQVGVYALTGDLADATTLAGTVNSGRICAAYLRGTTTHPEELAAAFAAVLCFEEDPARPLNTLQIKGIGVPSIPSRLTRTEQEACLHNGITPLEVGPGERVQIVRAVTTYTLDPQGVADISLLDLTTIRTLDYVRKALRERITLRFPREKLSAKTPPKVRSEILDVLYKLEELEIVENVDLNKDGVIVERDSQDPNRLNAKIPTDVVNGLHVFAGRIDLIL